MKENRLNPEYVRTDTWRIALSSMIQSSNTMFLGLMTFASYLASKGYQTEKGLFCYGQGYDNVERPSVQPGETMKIGCDMCMAVNTSLVNNVSSVYCADSYMIKGDGAERLHKAPQIIVRTY